MRTVLHIVHTLRSIAAIRKSVTSASSHVELVSFFLLFCFVLVIIPYVRGTSYDQFARSLAINNTISIINIIIIIIIILIVIVVGMVSVIVTVTIIIIIIIITLILINLVIITIIKISLIIIIIIIIMS